MIKSVIMQPEFGIELLLLNVCHVQGRDQVLQDVQPCSFVKVDHIFFLLCMLPKLELLV